MDLLPNPATRLFAVLGSPLARSRSPAIMNGLFRARKRNCLYLGMEVEAGGLQEIASCLHRLPFDGLNLTYPLKEEALSCCQELGDSARLIGAVNTMVRTKAGWRGLSTDGEGLLISLAERRSWFPEGANVVVLGAGGAARSALAALALRKTRSLMVFNRSLRRFESPFFRWFEDAGGICRDLAGDSLREALKTADLLLHATPFGLHGATERACWDLSNLNPKALVVDMNYRLDGATPFLEHLGSLSEVEDGRGMLAGQAVLGFEAWTGERPAISEALRAGGLAAD